MGRCVKVKCKYYAILYKEHDHPQILIWEVVGVELPPCKYQGELHSYAMSQFLRNFNGMIFALTDWIKQGSRRYDILGICQQ